MKNEEGVRGDRWTFDAVIACYGIKYFVIQIFAITSAVSLNLV